MDSFAEEAKEPRRTPLKPRGLDGECSDVGWERPCFGRRVSWEQFDDPLVRAATTLANPS